MGRVLSACVSDGPPRAPVPFPNFSLGCFFPWSPVGSTPLSRRLRKRHGPSSGSVPATSAREWTRPAGLSTLRPVTEGLEEQGRRLPPVPTPTSREGGPRHPVSLSDTDTGPEALPSPRPPVRVSLAGEAVPVAKGGLTWDEETAGEEMWFHPCVRLHEG